MFWILNQTSTSRIFIHFITSNNIFNQHYFHHKQITAQQNLSWLKPFGGGVDTQSFAQLHSSETQTQTDVDESRSYDPYLIAYHKESNSFTYNDPWVQMDQENQSSSKDNEISFTVENVVTTCEAPTDYVPLEPTITPQQSDVVQVINNGSKSTTENITQSNIVALVPAVEMVPEVSFPHNWFLDVFSSMLQMIFLFLTLLYLLNWR